MEIKLPCIILVRAHSKRLPKKWALPWKGGTLLSHCIQQARLCEHVSRVIVAADSEEIRDHAGLHSAEAVYQRANDEPVPDTQKSIEGVRYAQSVSGLEASYVLLCQCTSPFVNSEDLTRLILCSDLPRTDWSFLGRKGKPSGMGYVIPPFIGDVRGACIEQDAPDVDVDTETDYQHALKLLES